MLPSADEVHEATDPQVEVFLGLRDHAARQERELPGGDMASFFIAEGDLVIERAIAHGYEPMSVLVDSKRTKPLDLPDATTLLAASDALLTTITGRPKLKDPIACFRRAPLPDLDSVLKTANTVAVLEGINNPNNLGVIVRNAAGLGIDALVLDPTCGDPLYRRAIRASMGQVFAVPHTRIAALPEGLDVLGAHGFDTVALSPAGRDGFEHLQSNQKVAVLLGAEGPGLTPATMARCDHQVSIPMAREVDSLNVASAAAIAFHALARRA